MNEYEVEKHLKVRGEGDRAHVWATESNHRAARLQVEKKNTAGDVFVSGFSSDKNNIRGAPIESRECQYCRKTSALHQPNGRFQFQSRYQTICLVLS